MVSCQSLAHRLWCRTAETVAYGNEMLWRNQFFKFYLIKRRFAPRCCMECRKERCKAVFLKSATLSHHGTCYSRCNLMRLTERQVFNTHQRIRKFRDRDAGAADIFRNPSRIYADRFNESRQQIKHTTG
ncbi:hypothetical protein D3C80_863850 [compost metagenome]